MHVYDFFLLLFLFLTAFFYLCLSFTSLAFSLNPVSYSRSHHHTFNFLFNTKQRHIRRDSEAQQLLVYTRVISFVYFIHMYVYTMEYMVWYERPHFHRHHHRHHCHNAILLMDRAPHRQQRTSYI